jgi:hypothetical protein
MCCCCDDEFGEGGKGGKGGGGSYVPPPVQTMSRGDGYVRLPASAIDTGSAHSKQPQNYILVDDRMSDKAAQVKGANGQRISEALEKVNINSVKTVALGPGSQFVIITDEGRVLWGGENCPGFDAALDKLVNQGKVSSIVSVALGENESWVIVLEGGGYLASVTRNFDGLFAKMGSLTGKMRSVTMGQHGAWIIITDTNGYSGSSLPKSIVKRLNELVDAGTRIEVVLLGRDDNNVIKHSKGVFTDVYKGNTIFKTDPKRVANSRLLAMY